MHDTQYIQFFDGGHDPNIEILGGKCASLVSMTSAGMHCPARPVQTLCRRVGLGQ